MFNDNILYCEDLAFCAKQIDIKRPSSVLITGATGLIGTFLVDTLLKFNESSHHQIHITATGRSLERLKQHFIEHEHNPALTLREWSAGESLPGTDSYDYIIHLASNADPRSYALYPVETITTNLYGGINVLEYLKANPSCKAVFTSTFEVYGEAAQSGFDEGSYLTESDFGLIDFNKLRSGYPESKRVMELLVRSFVEEYGVNAVITRLCSIYGPTMHAGDNKAVAQFIRKSVNGEDIVLKSAGAQKRSYCYVADCVSGILTALFKGIAGEAYNIGNPLSEVTIRDMAERAASIAGTRLVFDQPDDLEQKGFGKAKDDVLNPQKLMELGYSPRYNATDGLQRTIAILKMTRHQ